MKPEVPSNTKKVNDPENLPTNQPVAQNFYHDDTAPSPIVVSAGSAKKISFQPSISPEGTELTFSVFPHV